MPARRTYRRKRVTRRPRTRRTKRTMRRKDTRTTMVSRELIVADRFSTLLRYINIDEPTLPAPGAQPYTSLVYRLNGLYDPSATLASTAIPGFTEIGNLYNNYLAQTAYISCTFMNNSAFPLIVGMTVNNGDSIVPITWSEFREQQGNQYTVQRVMGPNSGGGDVVTLRLKVSFASLLGDTKLYNGDLNYRGSTTGGATVGSNPNVIFPLSVYVLNVSNTGLPAVSYPYKMEIKWRTTFFGRINLT